MAVVHPSLPKRELNDCVALLKTYAKRKDLKKGVALHADIVKRGLLQINPALIGSSLVSLYAKCGSLDRARGILNELSVRDVVSWCELISGYTHQGQEHRAFDCFYRLQNEGISPDSITFICILKACGNIGYLHKGQHIHSEIVGNGMLTKSTVLGTSLVDMYARCGDLRRAQEAFNEVSIHDVVAWNALISGYTHHGKAEDALMCYDRMLNDGLHPNAVTFTCILKACGQTRAINKGLQIHDEIVQARSLKQDVVLSTALVDMYGKCGALEKAQEVFDEMPDRNVVSWSALIAGFSQNGHGTRAMDLFGRMPNEGVFPNTVTFVNVLTACAGTDDGFPKGKRALVEIESRGLLLEGNIELRNALIDTYAKSGEMQRAQEVFEEACGRDVVSWNALISGFSQHGKGEEALQYFQKMKDAHISPDVITFVCVLKACGSIGAFERGKRVHDEIISEGLLGEEAILSTALVDMYIKCGALGKARELFDEAPIRNVVSWNALISGYAQRGQCEEALVCFRKMQTEGIFPDQVTFLSVLVACCHSGRVEEGEMYFRDMTEKCGLTPGVEHETCMVELYSEAGLFDKALKVVAEMASCDYAMWCALLRACHKWGNVKVGRLAFDEAIQLDKSNSSAYVCMSNIYACAGMRIDVEQIEAMRIRNTVDQN